MTYANTIGAAPDHAPPPKWLAASEILRAIGELGLFATAIPGLLACAARGDGHPVLVLPGLLAGDRSTAPLRAILRDLGYDARRWDLGRNRGALAIGDQGELLAARIEEIFEETERKVSLVGWSLGGVFARLMARRLPDQVRGVVTLGSPFAGGPQSTNAAVVYRIASGSEVDSAVSAAMLDEMNGPSHIPSSAIYSRSDGICAWQACCEEPARHKENIEVYGSHCGLGVNPSVVYAIANRLAQDEGQWSPFVPTGLASLAYPAAGHA